MRGAFEPIDLLENAAIAAIVVFIAGATMGGMNLVLGTPGAPLPVPWLVVHLTMGVGILIGVACLPIAYFVCHSTFEYGRKAILRYISSGGMRTHPSNGPVWGALLAVTLLLGGTAFVRWIVVLYTAFRTGIFSGTEALWWTAAAAVSFFLLFEQEKKLQIS